MIGYRDMTFCPFLGCSHKDCWRRLTDEVREEAIKWWGGDDVPICQYSDKPNCYEESA